MQRRRYWQACADGNRPVRPADVHTATGRAVRRACPRVEAVRRHCRPRPAVAPEFAAGTAARGVLPQPQLVAGSSRLYALQRPSLIARARCPSQKMLAQRRSVQRLTFGSVMKPAVIDPDAPVVRGAENIDV